MEDAFDPFSNAVQPTVQHLWILLILIATLGCPNPVVGPGIDLRLPVNADEAFVSNDLTASQVGENGFGSFPLVGVSWHQFIDNWNATQGGEGHQFVAKIFHAT